MTKLKTEMVTQWKDEEKIVTILKIANCGKTEKLRCWQKSKSQFITTLTNLKKIRFWQNSKAQFITTVTKLKNSDFDKTQKLNLKQQLKTQNVNKIEKSNCGKIQRLKLWKNLINLLLIKLKTTILTKLKK